jgi:hypothetical protein
MDTRFVFLQVVFPFNVAMFLPQIFRNIYALDDHRKVLDLVTANHPLEVLCGRVTQCLVQSSCDLFTLDLPLSEALLVIKYSGDVSTMLFLPRVVVMQAALVHSEFHIRSGLRLPMDHKHQIITIVCDVVLIYQIAQSNDIGNSSRDEPNSLGVAQNSCFSIYYHGSTVSLQSHT